jgi:hypothetical protein
MKRIILSLTAGLLMGCLVGAQYHSGGYFGVTWGASSVAYGVKSDLKGKVTTMQLGTISHYDCEMAADNKLILVSDSTSGAIWTIDPFTMTITGTLFTDPALKTTAYGLQYDHNGDLYVFSSSRLFRIQIPGGLTTVTSGSFSLGNATVDTYTGEILIAAGVSNGVLMRIERQTGSTRTLGTGFATRYGDAALDPLTGDVYVSTCCGTSTVGRSLDVLRAGKSVSSIYLASTSLLGAYGPHMDRASAASPRIVTGCFRSSSSAASGGIWYIDLKSTGLQKVASFSTTTVANVLFLEGRNIQSTRTGPGQYTVNLSLPPDASRPYVMGVGITGVVPALPLPDGRRIPLVLDDLALLSIQGLLAPIVTGTVGALDPFGKATARIDVSRFYPGIRGLVMWMVAATFDPNAPLGVSTITDPHVLKVD